MSLRGFLQIPPQHISPEAQAYPQEPQLLSSYQMSMHELLQQAVPAVRHGGLHCKQTPFTQEKPGEQTVPQFPQLLLSVFLFTQFVPKQQVFSAGQQLPLQQDGLMPVQTFPQPPQLFTEIAKGLHSPLQH